ncbi:hypothetical protein ACFX1S_042106 [Malus domestica]
MAESVVCFVINKLISLLITTEAKLSRDVRAEVGFIRDELQSIRSFLRDADAKAAAVAEGDMANDCVKTWVNQEREAAFCIEDVIDEYLLRITRIDTMDEESLIRKSREYLQQKRYVVVFDDVWKVDFGEL